MRQKRNRSGPWRCPEYTYGELEAAIDIATTAGALIAEEKIQCENSRELIGWIIHAARQFETGFRTVCDPEDYLERVDELAEKALLERYAPGVDQSTYGYVDYADITFPGPLQERVLLNRKQKKQALSP